MWREFLQKNYGSREEWLAYSDAYGLAERLGFDSAEAAWDANPFIQGSTNPADFGLADLSAYYGERMTRWSNERLNAESAFALNPDDWSRKEVKDAWVAAIRAERDRRGLTPLR